MILAVKERASKKISMKELHTDIAEILLNCKHTKEAMRALKIRTDPKGDIIINIAISKSQMTNLCCFCNQLVSFALI